MSATASSSWMEPEMHRCKWRGCMVPVDNRFWGCPHHWNRLPLRLRVRLNRAWRNLQAARRARPGGLATVQLAEYRAADRAIAEWIERAIS